MHCLAALREGNKNVYSFIIEKCVYNCKLIYKKWTKTFGSDTSRWRIFPVIVSVIKETCLWRKTDSKKNVKKCSFGYICIYYWSSCQHQSVYFDSFWVGMFNIFIAHAKSNKLFIQCLQGNIIEFFCWAHNLIWNDFNLRINFD